MAVYTKKWNGSAWVTAPFKKWNGSAWVDAYVYKWTGSSWFQLYPEPIAYVNDKYVSGSGLTTYRTSYKDWKSGDAKQGSGADWDGSVANWGYCGISANSFTGTGSIASVTKQQYYGTRGASGYYNNDQTVYFYRCSVAGGGTAPDGRITGCFTSTTGGPGKEQAISTKTISGGEFKNWLNQVSGYPYLYIYSNVTGDYLDFDAITIITSYSYTAAAAMFVDDGQAVAFNISEEDWSMNGGEKIYHKMPIYKEEMEMTLYEIMDRRENGIVEDIDPTTVDYCPTILPWFRERETFVDEEGIIKFKIEVLNMQMEHEAQYSLDNVSWNTLYGTGEGDYVQTELPSDFNRYSDNIYVRIIDKDKDLLIEETVVEPLIYIP